MKYRDRVRRMLSKLAPTICAVLLLGACIEAPGESTSESATRGNPWTIVTTLTTPEEIAEFISPADAANAQGAEALAERWLVTIAEEEIAGVTVRTVTPAAIDPENQSRLFVHAHGHDFPTAARAPMKSSALGEGMSGPTNDLRVEQMSTEAVAR